MCWMMQLDLVVVEEPEEKAVRGNRKPALVEVHERHHVPSWWRRKLVIAEQLPLTRVGPRAEKAALDEAFHVCEIALRSIPQGHGRQEQGAKTSPAAEEGEHEP